MSNQFEPGDVVMDIRLTEDAYCSDGRGLRGVVARTTGEKVWGDWLYGDEWIEDLNSPSINVRLYAGPDKDQILASWVRWRLTDGA
jgi:hypothetical protein